MFVRVHIVYPGITQGRGKTEVMLLQLLGRILQECALAPASHPVPSGGAESCPLWLQAPVLVLFLHQSWTPAWCHGPASVEGACRSIKERNISGKDRENGLAVLGMLAGARAARSTQELTQGRARARALPRHSAWDGEENRSRNQDP